MNRSDSECERKIGFNSIEISKQECLGTGSYGAVYKAQCDDLICAAKVIHSTLVDLKETVQISQDKSHRLPLRRFEQECMFLSRIVHPNIIQYLGVCRDPMNNLPVLLMELMNQSLTNFLEDSEVISFRTQVNICHDIALALSFLHSNGIIHRDLSSNNILMIGDVRAKVTDFGMAIFEESILNDTGTICPGTPVYMPPEVKTRNPLIRDKMDCFSYGVLTIQILTKEFPKPEDRPYKKGVWDAYEPEIDLRLNHISLVPSDHPLRAIAINCLKYKHENRPTSRELCTRMMKVKNTPFPPPSTVQRDRRATINGTPEPQSCQPDETESLNGTRYDPSMMNRLAGEINQLGEKDEWVVVSTTDSQDFRPTKCTQIQDVSSTTGINWRGQTQRAPRELYMTTACVSMDGTIYFLYGPDRTTVYSFEVTYHKWTKLTESPKERASLAVVNTRLVAVGGKYSNKLYSLVDEKWEEKLPSMYTKRYDAVTASSSSHLIVIGGFSKSNSYLKTVEILNIDDFQWSVVAHVPEPCVGLSSASICARKIYIFSNLNSTVHFCELNTLVDSNSNSANSAWQRAEDLPVSSAASVVIDNKLYAIGGKQPNGRPTTAVYFYNQRLQRNNWYIVSHINTARSQCFASAIKRQMVVVGGVGESDSPIDTVETAIFRRMCY